MKPQYTIIIPFKPLKTHLEGLYRALNSVFSQTQYLRELEVVLVLNPANFELEQQILLNYIDKPLKIINSEKAGVNYARNLGVSLARGRYLLFIDSDCELPQNYLSTLHQTIKNNTGFDFWGGGYSSPSGISVLAAGYNMMANIWTGKFNESPNYLLGGNFCTTKDTFTSSIAFDESFKSGGDETSFWDLCHSKNKILFYADDLFVYHWESKSIFEIVQRAYKQGFARSRLQNSHVNLDYSINFIRALFSKYELFVFSVIHFPSLYFAYLMAKTKALFSFDSVAGFLHLEKAPREN